MGERWKTRARRAETHILIFPHPQRSYLISLSCTALKEKVGFYNITYRATVAVNEMYIQQADTVVIIIRLLGM